MLLDRMTNKEIQVHLTISLRIRKGEIFDYTRAPLALNACNYYSTIRKLLLYQVNGFVFLHTF